MLQITDQAMGVLKEARGSSGAPDEAAARFGLKGEAEEKQIGFAFVTGPLEGDERAADDGDLQVYVASELAAPLANSLLDVRPTEQGPTLVLQEQESSAG